MEPPRDRPRFPPPARSRSRSSALRRTGRVLSVALLVVLFVVPFLVITHLAFTGEPVMFLPIAMILFLGLGPVFQWRDEHRERRRREGEETHREAGSRRPCRQCGATRPAPDRGRPWPIDSITVARSGWAVGAAPGAAASVAFAAFLGLLDVVVGAPGPALGDAVLAAIVLVAPIGAVAGALAGVLAQFVARRRWDARGLNWRRCANSDPGGGDALTSAFWVQRHDRCLRAALRFRAAVDAVEEGPARDHLASLNDDVDREAQSARQAALWGQDIDPAPRLDPGPVPAAVRAHVDTLDTVARGLEAAAERAAAVAVALSPELDRMR